MVPPPAVSYRLRVEGFEGTGLGDRFRDLSALEDGDGSAETAAMIEARAQADEELAMRLLHSRGYFDASVTSAMERPSGPRNERSEERRVGKGGVSSCRSRWSPQNEK